ncbi:phosphoribosylglycinamide formyltransferase [Sphingomonas parva]|uniref:Phosphoribosylglycinamide formyltransferase n=1 Tax=Sphingomonas parva TaxID=2555898 RepID=A0A4Y8ZYS9_9SPHN|nr:phosphoribosylglycinamide formyltransferase [Sphingomonas parva]TFI60159.1 phosphoribosylglycinamide formyltransferase [Sphingomonas parva]
MAERQRIRVGVLLSGRGTNLAALSEYRRRQDRAYDLVLAASNVPEARGLVVARTLGLKTWARSHRDIARAEFDRLIDAELRRHDVEVVALAGYMRLLSPEFIRGWEGRILNIHPSLLPLYKGLDTHARALAAGDMWAGCSVHLVTDALDDGPVLAQARVRIRERDDAETLAARVLEEEHRLYPKALDEFCAELRGAAPR